LTLSRRLRIQPLLTPDNYAERVKPILDSAAKSLYFQNQYIKIGKENVDTFIELVDILKDKAGGGH
jgi:hypothetical protein